MIIEDQVCSLEFAKRLKELGIKQDSLFFWIKEEKPYIWYNSNNYPIHIEKFYYSAFTCSELGEILPAILYSNKESLPDAVFETLKNEQNRWLASYFIKHSTPPKIAIIDDTEVDARAKMLIHLLENGLIKP